MNNAITKLSLLFARLMNRLGLGMRAKLIIIFLLVKVIPLILLTAIAWRQFTAQGEDLSEIAVSDSAAALNNIAVENIERLSTDTALRVAEFLYGRDDDILYLAGLEPTEANYRHFVNCRQKQVVNPALWSLAPDGLSWIRKNPPEPAGRGVSTNRENNDMDGFNPRPAESFDYKNIPLYDEITFIDLEGHELIKVVSDNSAKIHYPLAREKKKVALRENTYLKAESYFEELKKLRPGEIYVSDVIGAYVGSNHIGMYTPETVARAARERGYEIEYAPEQQAYAGKENPNGRRFEGLVRWAAPVTGADGRITGYVTLALNHDHIMEFVDHLTPMNERYTELPSAYEGNYAFIWDYKCRNIAHPRHHSIVGFDPETGDPQIPWLEESIYEGWRASGLDKWTEYVKDYPTFYQQSRAKRPSPELTRQGLVGLDGRYLNNAPQCTGWMDLTAGGGSGSFYILWSGLYKLNTAAAIPYYTGQYAPSEDNGFSKRGFGFVAIGSGLESFTMPARATQEKLLKTVANNLRGTFVQLSGTTAILIVVVVLIAFWMASFMTNAITWLIDGISRFRRGERQFRFNARLKNEFGTLADSFDEMADSIVDSVKNPLSITDMNRNIIYINEYGLKACDTTLEKAIGTPYGLISIYPPGSKYCPITALEEGREAEVLYLEDQRRYFKGAANYLLSRDGRKIGYIVESTDVTEMVVKQIALERAMNAAKRANEHKGEFLARMSHEIRTPMNAIIGLANIVRDILEKNNHQSPALREITDHMRQIEASSQHLLCLLNDILDISKIEAGKIHLSLESMDLGELIKTVSTIIKPRCDEKKIFFLVSFEPFEPSTFLSDALRLRQVLINLLGNAVKFTPENGRVEFYVARKARQNKQTLIEFSIRDNGIGISGEALANIFQPFEQGGGQITRQYGGTGLGLAISRHIVQLFGGRIKVSSALGEGSTFSFAIWLEETDRPSPQKAAASLSADAANIFTGRRALLVDDVDLNRKVARAMLKNTGLMIDEAEDGLAALKRFEESPVGAYDVILMDIQMPNMDGYQASQAIRALNRADARKVPIIAQTANAFQDDIDKALAAGMNAHIAKPLKLDKLVEVLKRFMAF